MITRVILFVALSLCCACGPPSLQRFEFTQPKMGTTFRVVLYAPNADVAEQAATATFSRIDQLNSIFSDYDASSEIRRVAALPPGTESPISRELADILAVAEEVRRRSAGAFDVTIGPLTKLWRRTSRQKVLPSPKSLDAARDAVGGDRLRLEGETLTLLAPDMRLDLGGIAKGFTLDEALLTLAAQGVDVALIDGGGDIAVRGTPPGQTGWDVAIASASSPERASLTLRLGRHESVATSGDLFRFVEIDGVRYSHIVDPRTGLGLTHRVAVTVIGPDATLVDALASALSLIDPDHGITWVTSLQGYEARILIDEDRGPTSFQTPGFGERLVD